MSTPDIRELSSDEEVCEAFPIVAELRDHLDEARYLKLYERLRTGIGCSRWTTGYRSLSRESRSRRLLSRSLRLRLRPRHDGQGALEETRTRLLEHVREWAADRDCEIVELEAGLWRDDAHRFYTESMEHEKYCYSFVRHLF